MEPSILRSLNHNHNHNTQQPSPSNSNNATVVPSMSPRPIAPLHFQDYQSQDSPGNEQLWIQWLNDIQSPAPTPDEATAAPVSLLSTSNNNGPTSCPRSQSCTAVATEILTTLRGAGTACLMAESRNPPAPRIDILLSNLRMVERQLQESVLTCTCRLSQPAALELLLTAVFAELLASYKCVIAACRGHEVVAVQIGAHKVEAGCDAAAVVGQVVRGRLHEVERLMGMAFQGGREGGLGETRSLYLAAEMAMARVEVEGLMSGSSGGGGGGCGGGAGGSGGGLMEPI